MSLYYDTRIRDVVVKEWAESKIQYMGGRPQTSTATEDTATDTDRDDASYIFKDMPIPLSFRNNIARKLYEKEDEAIIASVKLKRKEDLLKKTVYTANEEDRLELVRDYKK